MGVSTIASLEYSNPEVFEGASMESADERGHNVTMSEDLWGPTVNREVYALGLKDLVCDIHWHAHLRPLT